MLWMLPVPVTLILTVMGSLALRSRASVLAEMRKSPTALVKEAGAPSGSSWAVIFTSGMDISTSTSERMKLAMRGSASGRAARAVTVPAAVTSPARSGNRVLWKVMTFQLTPL
ncbi:unknown [Akkermansia sp. CAG:344]|nr:unknown [Akkermansia sp. CAG:344]